ncbi:hypothetical protein CERZMDRAFT_95912 [Cercospora zeae-maydis SCOH1-5]|uniref:Heterokaryon incompatibility domain-containing protein n=1 Tax=Cercospora zeae-maydis SCOH1-5 TaxID=717836 RepID=A0A6A6FKS0_9PEZI|nr:hypothetical protein CERZMDRAFT_95912 [Cercospora zeae-maydis SCOH1-5]
MIFQYAHLRSDAIRLIRIHARSTYKDLHVTLEHQSKYSEPDVHYSVLSYQPAGPDMDRQGVTLNGRTRTIDFNAWSALADAAKNSTDSDPFWLDTLCINQQDKAEVMQQHRHRGKIYAGAEKVLLHLPPGNGKDQVPGDLASRAQAYISQASDREALLQAKKVVVVLDGQRCDLGARDLEESMYPRESL